MSAIASLSVLLSCEVLFPGPLSRTHPRCIHDKIGHCSEFRVVGWLLIKNVTEGLNVFERNFAWTRWVVVR